MIAILTEYQSFKERFQELIYNNNNKSVIIMMQFHFTILSKPDSHEVIFTQALKCKQIVNRHKCDV